MNEDYTLYILAFVYLLALNLFTFALMGYDKKQAVRNARRVPERRFVLLALLGGATGAWLGMRHWRHKTKHRSFVIGMPVLMIANVAMLYGAATILR